MKTRNTFTKLITMVITVAGLAVIGSGWMPELGRTAAQFQGDAFSAGDTGVFTICGLLPRQTLRVNVYNPNTSRQRNAVARAQVRLYDAAGNVLAQKEEPDLRPGRFNSLDFDRAELAATGEPNNGRLQVRAQVKWLFADGSVSVSPDNLLASVETIDNGTGKTLAAEVLASRLGP